MPASQAKIAALVDAYFKPLIYQGQTSDAAKAPGGICGVFYQGQTWYFPYGFINEDHAAPDENTVFGIGSVTKTLTTSILGQQPSLFLANVNDYLPPGYKLSAGMADLNFQELATFTSGIPTYPSAQYGGDQACAEQFIQFINAVDPAALPAPNVYSDSSIGLLGQLLMYKDEFEIFNRANATAWYKANLLDALSMNSTFAMPAAGPGKNWSLAYSFTNEKDPYVPIDYAKWKAWGTAGRIFSTCSDMINFVQANCGVNEIAGKVVSENILEGMERAQQNNVPPIKTKFGKDQAFAWVLFNTDPDGSTTFCGKDGGVAGVSSYVTACPGQQLGVVFLTNNQYVPVNSPAINLTQALISMAISS